jgi:hypothetical protein
MSSLIIQKCFFEIFKGGDAGKILLEFKIKNFKTLANFESLKIFLKSDKKITFKFFSSFHPLKSLSMYPCATPTTFHAFSLYIIMLSI